jgi:dimethylglycine oxidase
MVQSSRLVIIGAGIVGTSTAYHLARMGWRDILVLDQGSLFHTGGSTSHAPGLIFQTNPSRLMTEYAKYTVDLLKQLSTDDDPCFFPVGGIEVATTPERWHDLKRKHGLAQSYGLESALISPAEVKEKIPLIDKECIYGGYFVSSDGDAKAVRAVEAMAEEVEALGAGSFVGQTQVTDIEIRNGRLRAVVHDKGQVETDQVLLCTNIWSPVLAEKVSVKLPLMPVEHQYAISEPMPELAGETREIIHPILRHQDQAMYFRQHGEAYGIGSYLHQPRLVDPYKLGPTATHAFTPEHFTAALKAAEELLPPLCGRDYPVKFNGIFSFTVDGMPIMGEVPGIGGLWLAVGVWVTHSGGVGKAMAEWMNDGATGLDTREVDLHRFQPYAFTRRYIVARCAQQYREVYDIIHPLQQINSPRNLRTSPFHPRLQELGAEFFESAGWERPQWFHSNKGLLDRFDVPDRKGWTARYWSLLQGVEHLATRDTGGIFDVTPFTKIEVSGLGALSFLEKLAANRIDQPVGRVVYTSFLNERGGIVSDLTITRLGDCRFLIVTGGAGGKRDLTWIMRHVPKDGSVAVVDLTSGYCGLGLWGPNARSVLQETCTEELSNENFPYFTARQITIGYIPALALRVSYVGELGWEIYTSNEYGLNMWDTLWEASRPYGLVPAGGGAFDSLRLEKGYRLWGVDIYSEHNPYEAGLGWAVRLEKGEFIGRQALLAVKEAPLKRKLTALMLADPAAIVMGKEPIYAGSRRLGYVTSANYGYSIGKCILYGYLPVEYSQVGTMLEVEFFGKRLTANVVNEPIFDPDGEKLKV